MPRSLQPCGTAAAYVRHLRHGEPPCTDCLAANNRRNDEVRGRQDWAELPARPADRNGLPFRPYVYRGTGEDTLTGYLDDGLEAAS